MIGWHRGTPITAARFCAAAIGARGEPSQEAPGAQSVRGPVELHARLHRCVDCRAGKPAAAEPRCGVVREIFASHPDICCLADHNELPAGLPAMIVPPWPAAGGRVDMPSIPADQMAMIVFTRAAWAGLSLT